MRVAIVGATGAVGQEFETLLAEREFPADEYRLLVSERSAGRELSWCGKTLRAQLLEDGAFEGVDVAFFSAGASTSRAFAAQAVEAGAVVIDNSSAFRMDADTPLVVPEINPDAARAHRGVIANPNCSTIIMLIALWPLHRVNRARRVVVDTYQAASGAGAAAMAELEQQSRDVLAGGEAKPELFHVPCAFNVFSHNTPIGDDGLNTEERKLIAESRKILGDDAIRIAPTCIRVPVLRAHTEALTIEFEQPMPEAHARALLADAPGVRVVDDRENNIFPMPIDASGRDDVLVGRIRQDASLADQRGLQLLCSGDQLRKGAALNAVQIAELLFPN